MQLLIEKGYDRFSLQDVGQQAKCSYELVNFYFGNKDGLLNALAKYIIGNLSSELQSLDEAPNGFDKFAQKIRYVATVADRDSTTFTAYLRIASEAPFQQPLTQLCRARRSETVDIFRDSIIAGKASGDIRRNVDANEIAHVSYDFVRGHVDRRLLDRDNKSTTKFGSIIETFIELLRTQIAVRKR